MGQNIRYSQDARSLLVAGVDYVADAVKTTLGPGGRLVVIDRREWSLTPHATKDGVTVARSCLPDDLGLRLGADLAMDAAHRTVTNAGDGTTTATLLVQAIVHAGLQQLAANHSPGDLERGIKLAVTQVAAALSSFAISTSGDMLYHVALISSNGDEQIARLVAEAIAKVGKDGILTSEESRSTSTYLDVSDGLEIPQGLLHPCFINQLRPECIFDDPLILLYEEPLNFAKPLTNLLKLVLGMHRPLLAIVGDIGPEALAMFVQNRTSQNINLPVAVVRASAYGPRRKEILRDIATLTGGTAITPELGFKIEGITEKQLGQARRIVSTEHKTMILGGKGDKAAIESRIAKLRQEIADEQDEAQKALLERRFSGLTGGIAVIKVGGSSYAEMKERKDRVEDATFATKAAVEEGVVPGGGLALLWASQHIQIPHDASKGMTAGMEIVREVCTVPMNQIAENAGESGKFIVSKTREGMDVTPQGDYSHGKGWNASTGKFEDLIETGVLDPAKVVREALVNAASVATVILKTEAVISKTPDAEVTA